MVVIVGKMASGKTTTAKGLVEKGFSRAITDTTRPIRDGEIDGIDYNFVSEEEFSQNDLDGIYAESTGYEMVSGKVFYASRKDSYKDPNGVIVLNPYGLRAVRKNGIDCTAVYLKAKKETLMNRLEIRGDDAAEVERRLAADERDFAGIEPLCDYILEVDNLTEDEVTDAVNSFALRENVSAPKRLARRKATFAAKKRKKLLNVARNHDSDYKGFLKRTANKKVRAACKADIRKHEEFVEEESCVKNGSQNGKYKKAFDIGWKLT